MKACTLVVLAVFTAAQEKGGEKKEAGPVDKVVALLEEMQARLEQDQKNEQKIYDKYACWCEKTTAQKAEEIEAAKAELKQLGTKILELKGLIATSAAEIADLTKDIQKNEEAQKEFTEIREKAHSAFMAEKVELEEAISALEKAIMVLHSATGGELVQTGLASALKVAQRVAPRYDKAISAPQLALVNKFLTLVGKGQLKDTYAPASATIQGILKDMYDTFSANLESQTKEESTAQAQFEDFIATKMKSLKTMQETLQKKETVKAEAETQEADATEAFADTEAQLKADIGFFEATKESCDKKAADWLERKELRAEEMEGIAKALEILTSDDAEKLFATSIGKLFLEEVPSRPEPVRRALAALRTSSQKTQSLRLAAIAAQLRTSERGHFDKVIKSIEMMMETLKKEGQADEDQNEECKEQLHDVSSKVADMDWKIANQKAAIEKLEHIATAKGEERAAVVESIVKMKKEMEDMEDQRKEENSAFLEEKEDDEKAIEVLEKAKAALGKYYSDNAKLFLQEGSSKDFLQKSARVMAVEPPPDATFSKKGSRKTEAKGILAILSQIIENLHIEISDAVKAEESTQAAFEKSMKAAKKLVKDFKAKKTNLEETIAAKKEAIEDEEKVMHEQVDLMEDQYKLRADIKPDCDWIAKHIDERREKRAMEVEGLTAARDYLAGMAPPSMAQTSASFDDDTLPSIGFSSVSFLQRRSA